MAFSEILNWIIFAVSGRLLIEVFQRSPLSEYIYKTSPTIEKIGYCGLCSGFFTYLVINIFFKINVINFIGFPLFSSIITSSITSFIVWMFETGWKARFTNIIVK